MAEHFAGELKLGAITSFTTLDYPGKLAAVAFVQGCPWNCTYCQNGWLRAFGFDPRYEHESWESLEALLSRRKGLLDAVVFSGGEPLSDPALPEALARVREMGFLTAVHTCGAYPAVLERIVPLIDWAGLDIKAPLRSENAFSRIIRVSHGAEKTERSLEILLASGKPFECRTTCHPAFLSEAELLEIAEDLSGRGVKSYALQPFRVPPGGEEEALFENCPMDYPSKELTEKMKGMFENFTVRR